MPANKDDLFTRAATAAARVTELKGEIAVRKVELKKALADARSLKRDVMQALSGVRMQARGPRKPKPVAPAANQGLYGPLCWFDGCNKRSVAAVSDFEGKTWECCADHMVASASEDAGGPL